MAKREYGDGKSIIEILNIGFEPLLTDEEFRLNTKIRRLNKEIARKEKIVSFVKSKILYLDESDVYYKWLVKVTNYNKVCVYLENNIVLKNKCKEKLKELLIRNIPMERVLIDNRKFEFEDQCRNINIFESDLTRILNCKDMEHSDGIISVVTYYTEIFESIVNNGFIYKDKKYIFFTAGAGQTRNKKSTFILEEELEKNIGRLFCGLTRDIINNNGGMNTNKYLAYTSLCQTNTSIWKNFDIDKAIVVEDIEFSIPDQEVRYIYTETPEDKLAISELRDELDIVNIRLRQIKEEKQNYERGKRRPKDVINEEKKHKERRSEISKEIQNIRKKYHKTDIKKMDITIPFTDGFGVCLKEEPNAMVRLPFMKGLLSYISRSKFKKFCKENGFKIYKIMDIYGKEHHIDNIDYIFTKSQFKMYKYYQNELDDIGNVIKTGWEVYKENFKSYGCDACRCNIDNGVKLNAKTNYQVLQTLTTEMTDEDILELGRYDIDNLNGIGEDINCMLNILGANSDKNDRMSWLQKSLVLYPEMLKDFYIRKLLKDTKDSMLNKIRSGKFSVNGAYTFIIPEPLACMQWWFNGERDLSKLGIIKKDEVVCRLFKKEEVDCLRSPHLDHSHCIRNNKNDEESKYWYGTDGLYVGVNDIMSKVLMNDNDGDTALVHNNATIIKCAKSYQEKYKMIPNYYDMPKANPQQLDNKSLFDGIVMAYHHGNIGTPSNEITKIFDTLNVNSSKEEILEAIEVVALRCSDVNYTIDYAKTLYKPDIPNWILERYKKYSNRKVPRFFVYAKGKSKGQVEEKSENNINRISNIVKSKRITFKDLLGSYQYAKMMNAKYDIKDVSEEDKQKILDLYNEIDLANKRELSKHDLDFMEFEDRQKVKILLSWKGERQKTLFQKSININEEYIANILIKELHGKINQDSLWRMFGETIFANLQTNLENTKICECCKERFEYAQKTGKPKVYCDICAYEKEIEKYEKYNQKRVKNS